MLAFTPFILTALTIILTRPIPNSWEGSSLFIHDLNGFASWLILTVGGIWQLWDPPPYRTARGLRNMFGAGAMGFLIYPIALDSLDASILEGVVDIKFSSMNIWSFLSFTVCSGSAVLMEMEYRERYESEREAK